MGKGGGGEREVKEGQEVQSERKQTTRAALGDLWKVSLRTKGPEEELKEEKQMSKEILRYFKQFQTRVPNL